MNNFAFKHNINGVEKTLWYSRSVAVGLFAFAIDKKGNWFVLACKRGAGCPSDKGKWNCPGGFVDFDETLYKTANRECWEETGLNVAIDKIRFHGFNSYSESERQTISVRFYTILDGYVEDLHKKLTDANTEENECLDIRFIRVDDIYQFDWAFNHEGIIDDIYRHIIKESFWSKLKRAFSVFKPDTPYYINEPNTCV